MKLFIVNLILVSLALAAFFLRCQQHPKPKTKDVPLKGLKEMKDEDRQALEDERMLEGLTLSGPFTLPSLHWGDTPSEWPTTEQQKHHPVPHRPVDPHYGDTPSEWNEAQNRPLDWSS